MKRKALQTAALIFLPFLSVANIGVTAQVQDKPVAVAGMLAGRCATFVRDAHPPANVRSAPDGPSIAKLDNDIELHVDEDRGGWLHTSAPVRGWIHVSVTTVYCGSKSLDNVHAVTAAIDKVGTRAKSDPLAADTLMRYWVFGAADGYAGETTNDALGALMAANPKLLISVLDQLPETKREDLLRTLAMGGSTGHRNVRAFERAVSEEPMHPTSITWKRLAQKCGPDLTRLPNC